MAGKQGAEAQAQARGGEQSRRSLRPFPALLGIALFLLLLLLPAPEGLSVEGWRVVAVACLMIVWWITEAIPALGTGDVAALRALAP